MKTEIKSIILPPHKQITQSKALTLYVPKEAGLSLYVNPELALILRPHFEQKPKSLILYNPVSLVLISILSPSIGKGGGKKVTIKMKFIKLKMDLLKNLGDTWEMNNPGLSIKNNLKVENRKGIFFSIITYFQYVLYKIQIQFSQFKPANFFRKIIEFWISKLIKYIEKVIKRQVFRALWEILSPTIYPILQSFGLIIPPYLIGSLLLYIYSFIRWISSKFSSLLGINLVHKFKRLCSMTIPVKSIPGYAPSPEEKKLKREGEGNLQSLNNRLAKFSKGEMISTLYFRPDENFTSNLERIQNIPFDFKDKDKLIEFLSNPVEFPDDRKCLMNDYFNHKQSTGKIVNSLLDRLDLLNEIDQTTIGTDSRPSRNKRAINSLNNSITKLEENIGDYLNRNLNFYEKIINAPQTWNLSMELPTETPRTPETEANLNTNQKIMTYKDLKNQMNNFKSPTWDSMSEIDRDQAIIDIYKDQILTGKYLQISNSPHVNYPTVSPILEAGHEGFNRERINSPPVSPILEAGHEAFNDERRTSLKRPLASEREVTLTGEVTRNKKSRLSKSFENSTDGLN